ncbi:MAG: DMT family transporter [Hyphomicrobium sp.]|nr:DMT family transporter [Hyphomicrobium sp.]
MASFFWSVSHAIGDKGRVSGDSEAVGYTVGLLTWVLAGGVFVAVKLGINEMPPWTLCCWRVFLSALVLLPFVMSHHHEIVDFLRKRWPEALFIGAIGLGLTQGTMFTALSYTSAINTGIIFATTPIIAMVLAHFVIHERMNGWQALGSAIAFLGIVVIAVHGSLAKLLGLKLGLGDLLVVAGAMMFACYSVLLKRAKFELDRLPLLFVLLCAGALSTVPFYLWEVWNGEHGNLAFKGYMVLLYAAIPGGALMYLCYNWSIDILGPSRAGTLLYTQMIFTAIFAWLILGESIEWYHYVGAGLIIVGVVLVTWLAPKQVAAAAK